VERETGRSEFTLLDVAAGSGDIPETARQRLASRGITLWGTLLDRAETHLGHNGLPAVLGDGLALPFRDGSFDLVSSALFIHHLEPDGVVRFMREALRVCRLAVLINDLRRSPIHLALVYAGFPLYRSRLTRHDGPASVRRAYTPEELLPMLERAGAARIQIQESYLYRMGVIAWRRNTT
jgi:ubiquinone/menaquinone biosynthesis C-methylase UbiE